MSSVLQSSCVLAFILIFIVPPYRGQGSDCSCNATNSRCDESGVCRCDPGWDGERCERCVPMPGCLHGNCQQPWQCRCEAGWAGRFCDRDLTACSRRPCQHGATCVMEDSGTVTCLCPHGFHGSRCELKAGPCHLSRSLCKNGGQCEDADGFAAAPSCRCLAGFTGPRCETDLDDCLMTPCANGATCLDGINRFSCVCPAGFSGRFCTVNLDDCAGRPCLNGGRCLDRAGGFHCVCRPGFRGDTCQTALGGGDGGGAGPRLTTKNQRSGGNGSRHGDRMLKVTVSERSAGGLSRLQLVVLLVLAAATLGAVLLTAALVLQGHCRGCGHAPSSSSSSSSSQRRARRGEPECQISFLNAAEPKKKLNTEIM